jgi:hypothetical protein
VPDYVRGAMEYLLERVLHRPPQLRWAVFVAEPVDSHLDLRR